MDKQVLMDRVAKLLVNLLGTQATVAIRARSSLIEKIRAHKFDNPQLRVIHERVLSREDRKKTLYPEGNIKIESCICVPRVRDLVKLIHEEAHYSKYSINLSAAKMYLDLRQQYWWCRIKRDIVAFMARCLNYQQVKFEYQRPGGLTQLLPILEWK
ncbi:uncharacterized protein LOC129899881 [Solanum dulcamara]|uniref:uncharacterized protein LOC129899881 n=1 Tax=Solanum dulcamara TaxID=45834 RepID=UPI002484FECA|nr:uncharacterized protein LOC129899881 [Solanum dulcamara]